MKKKNNDTGGFVYSTDPDGYNDLPDNDDTETPPPNQQDLRITIDKKLKGGKKATVIYNFVGKEEDLEALAKRLKSVCAVGGTAKDGEIILQGDHLEKVKAELTKLGYKYKVAGV